MATIGGNGLISDADGPNVQVEVTGEHIYHENSLISFLNQLTASSLCNTGHLFICGSQLKLVVYQGTDTVAEYHIGHTACKPPQRRTLVWVCG